ncbi:hypothetical protein FRC07_004251 [Ceratobasidium sp. 392]|nr:hypothetical protein FRC07_004251 [Ceratobasidium sp. 392]
MSQNVNPDVPPGAALYYPPPGVDGAPLAVVPVQMVQQALAPMSQSSRHTEELVDELARDMKEVKLKTVTQAEHQDPGDDGDDEGLAGTQPRGRKRARKDEDEDKPKGQSLNNMQNSFRKVLFSGCDVEKMSELQTGLSPEEFEKRKEEDPSLPWRPNFMANADSPSNAFWIDKMVDAYMTNPDVLKMVEAKKIDEKYWTRDSIIKYIIKPMWYSARAGVKQATDPTVRERVKRQGRQGLQNARQKRLLEHRIDNARHDKPNPFGYEVNGKLRSVPKELLTEEITSDVISDSKYEPQAIRPDVSKEEYRAARKAFMYEGIPPFWRRDMWNKIVRA